MRSKKTLMFVIVISLLSLGGCKSWFHKEPVIVSYEPPTCRIVWSEEDRLELFAFMDSELSHDGVFQKIAEYRRYCNSINDYIARAK